MQKWLSKFEQPSAEGIVIFLVVGYETVALSVNFVAGKKVITPITDILGPLTHKRYGKVMSWLFLGWAWDHFYQNGERALYELEIARLTDG